ncbi:MFS transporter [Granulosicoccus antarcticus]|uniref:Inner membrane protein YbjJ n=1 Tax=Granulosicoccus antarcticus IMCC3135 TaxID=1192854 RepID=A0A2Z2NZ38_9GAMM|nr:MFS transporter [Granulosicoccus antarcticus]ASJ76716.1 Inner membrane protein YbjJ [Granulosicoccus antarcticus IMCC3135]
MSDINTAQAPRLDGGATTSVFSDPSWRAVAAAFAFNGALFGTWASRVPAFKGQFSLDAAELGLLLLVLAAGAIIAFPLAGLFSDRLGARRVTFVTAVLYGPVLALLGFAQGPFMLALALFVFGALHGAMDVGMNGWGARVEEKLGRPVMSVFHALFSLGAGVGAGLGVLATHMSLSPATHLPVAAVLFAVPTLALLVIADAHRPEGVRKQEQPGKVKMFAIPRGTLLLVGLIAFGVSIGEGAMADWSAVFLRDATAATESAAALGYAVFSTTMVATRLAGDTLITRLGPVVVVRASGIVAALGIIMVVTANAVPMALTGFAVVGVGYAVVMPLVFSRAARDPDTPSGTAIAAVATLGYGGMLLGPVLVGFVAHLTTLAIAMSMLAALAIGVALLARFINPAN